MNKIILDNTLIVKQTIKESISDSSESFIVSNENIEKLKEKKRNEISNNIQR